MTPHIAKAIAMMVVIMAMGAQAFGLTIVTVSMATTACSSTTAVQNHLDTKKIVQS